MEGGTRASGIKEGGTATPKLWCLASNLIKPYVKSGLTFIYWSFKTKAPPPSSSLYSPPYWPSCLFQPITTDVWKTQISSVLSELIGWNSNPLCTNRIHSGMRGAFLEAPLRPTLNFLYCAGSPGKKVFKAPVRHSLIIFLYSKI